MSSLSHFPRLKTASPLFPNLIFVEADKRLTAGVLVLTEDYTVISISVNENIVWVDFKSCYNFLVTGHSHRRKETHKDSSGMN